jgi:hypothetical protein
MAVSKSPSIFKICANCDRWCGPRRPSMTRREVEYASDKDIGECVGGMWNGQNCKANASCNKWSKWSMLK